MSRQTDAARSRPCCRSLNTVAVWAVLLPLTFTGAARLLAQAPSENDTEMRNRALLLWQQNDYAGALPLLDKLAAAHPADGVVLERLGGALAGSAQQVADAETRKKVLLRARSMLLRAKELGDNSNYLNVMLEKLPESGEVPAFSTRKEVDDALREGEAAFGKSDFAGAIAAYQRAYQLDPNDYHAALFTGDVYFKMNQMDKAGKWFSKAVAIDPDRETAYRYWGDALVKDGKMQEAKDKFIDAVVAEPYQRTSWIGLTQWAKANQTTISHPKIESPASVSEGEGGQINITLGLNSADKKNGSTYWLGYAMSRALWRGDKFKKEFPSETTYRHSLREEVEALEIVVDTVSPDAKKPRKRKHLDPALLALLKLHDQGLLEAYVLLSRPDEGIARDYAAYRAAHRDQLRRYVSDWLISTDNSRN